MADTDAPRAPLPHDPLPATENFTPTGSSSAVSTPRADENVPAPVPASAGASSAPSFVTGLAMTALVATSCGLLGSYLYQRFLPPPRDAYAPASPVRNAVDSSTAESQNLADRVDRLKAQVDRLQRKTDRQANQGPPPEVAALQVRVADLTESTNGLAPLPSKVDHIDNRLRELSSTLTTLREDLAATQTRYGRTPRLASSGSGPRVVNNVTTPAAPTTALAPLPGNRRPGTDGATTAAGRTNDGGLARGAALFHKGQYKAANEVFGTLEPADPQDARVWYYAALSRGLSTNDWTDASIRLVEKGVAREQAGTPKTSLIDAEFRALTSATGKDWLAAYRKRVNADR